MKLYVDHRREHFNRIGIQMRIELPVPLSVNSLYRTFRGRMLLSKKGREWIKLVVPMITRQAGCIHFQHRRISVVYRYAFKDHMRRDIFNYEKILSDCFTKAGIWDDDCQIDDGRVIRLPVDKENPRCEVTIEVLQ